MKPRFSVWLSREAMDERRPPAITLHHNPLHREARPRSIKALIRALIKTRLRSLHLLRGLLLIGQWDTPAGAAALPPPWRQPITAHATRATRPAPFLAAVRSTAPPRRSDAAGSDTT